MQGDANNAKITGPVKDLESLDRHLIIRSKNTGSWLTTRDTTVTSTVVSATGFRDFLSTCYNVTPPNLQKCDGCSLSLYIRHELSCTNRDLVITRHKKIRDELLYLT